MKSYPTGAAARLRFHTAWTEQTVRGCNQLLASRKSSSNRIVCLVAAVANLCVETHCSEDFKVVTGHHVTLVKSTDLIQEHVFLVRNLGSTAGVCPVIQHQQSRPHLVCQLCQLS